LTYRRLCLLVALLSPIAVVSANARGPGARGKTHTSGSSNEAASSLAGATTQPLPAPRVLTPAGAEAEPARAEDVVAAALERTVLIEGDGVYGSGLLLVPRRGLIVTNWHVVEEMKQPRVTFFGGRSAAARVVEIDRALDLALLEGPTADLTPPRVGDAAELRPAQTLYAIGSPRKLGFTVSRGIVSYVGRPMDGTRFLQTDLAINDGNSGGPVLTARGEVVGIMSFILKRSTGLAFALPINYVIERFAARLPEDAARSAYLDRFRSWKTK
jgi:S1-C subfamily serine protease